MAEFRIEIAGKVFAVRSRFDSARDYCKQYLTEAEADFSVDIAAEDLTFEQAFLDEEAREEGFRLRKFTDPFLDRAAIQRKVAEALCDCGTLLVHGSAVALDGKGYLFTAKSGTGKSTHTRYWLEAFGNRAAIINDDKPFIRLDTPAPMICGAPWSGKHGLDTNLSVPLAGICILERGEENRITAIAAQEALPMLLHQASPPLAAEKQPQFEAMVTQLTKAVPLWRMECTRNIEAARVAHDAMRGNEEVKTL
jgi:hypothetical protein